MLLFGLQQVTGAATLLVRPNLLAALRATPEAATSDLLDPRSQDHRKSPLVAGDFLKTKRDRAPPEPRRPLVPVGGELAAGTIAPSIYRRHGACPRGATTVSRPSVVAPRGQAPRRPSVKGIPYWLPVIGPPGQAGQARWCPVPVLRSLVWQHDRSRERKWQPSAAIAAFDEGDLVPFLVMGDLVHERAHEEQAAAADLFQVHGIRRVGQLRWVEAGTFVADGVDRL